MRGKTPQRGGPPHALAAHEAPLAVSEPAPFVAGSSCEGGDLNLWTTGRRFLLASLAGLRLPWSRSLPLVAHETSTGADFESDVGALLSVLITHGIYAREERPREAVFRTAEQCEGGDLNPWTSTGADLESAAVSRLGYPRTRAQIPHRPRPHSRSRHASRSRTEGIGSSAFAILNSSGPRSRTRLPWSRGTERETVSRPARRTGVAFRPALARSV